MQLCIGKVKANYDSEHPGMVQVSLPDFLSDGGDTAWLPVCSPYAGKDYGIYFLPEKDEQVVVGFLNGDAQSGIVLGSLWNKKNTIPKNTATENNEVRSVVTKGGHTITLKDGDNAEITVKSIAGHTVTISDKDKKITVSTSGGKEKIILDENGGSVTINADKTVTIKAVDIKLEGKLTAKGEAVAITSNGKLELKGNQTALEGNTMAIKGQSSEYSGANMTVKSSGMLTLQGSMVKIN